MDAFAPVVYGPRMHTAKRLPSIQIFQRNGEVTRVRLDVLGNAPP